MADRQRVLWSFYLRPTAKAALNEAARQRSMSTSELVRRMLSFGLRRLPELDREYHHTVNPEGNASP